MGERERRGEAGVKKVGRRREKKSRGGGAEKGEKKREEQGNMMDATRERPLTGLF